MKNDIGVGANPEVGGFPYILSNGGRLLKHEGIRSNGYAAILEDNCNFVVYKLHGKAPKEKLWDAGTDNEPTTDRAKVCYGAELFNGTLIILTRDFNDSEVNAHVDLTGDPQNGQKNIYKNYNNFAHSYLSFGKENDRYAKDHKGDFSFYDGNDNRIAGTNTFSHKGLDGKLTQQSPNNTFFKP